MLSKETSPCEVSRCLTHIQEEQIHLVLTRMQVAATHTIQTGLRSHWFFSENSPGNPGDFCWVEDKIWYGVLSNSAVHICPHYLVPQAWSDWMLLTTEVHPASQVWRPGHHATVSENRWSITHRGAIRHFLGFELVDLIRYTLWTRQPPLQHSVHWYSNLSHLCSVPLVKFIYSFKFIRIKLAQKIISFCQKYTWLPCQMSSVCKLDTTLMIWWQKLCDRDRSITYISTRSQ